MKNERLHLKLFLSIFIVNTSTILIWLMSIRSISSDIFFLWYSKSRFILLLIVGVVLFSLIVLLIFSNKPFLQQSFRKLIDSKTFYTLSIVLSAALFIILAQIALGSLGRFAFLLERAAPVIVLAFLFIVELFVFQYFLSRRKLEHANWDLLDSGYLQPNGRDARLDFLRGLFVFIMIVDHIGEPSILYKFTFGNTFFTSAAEGFYLVSGIVTGMVYLKVLKNQGMAAVFEKSARRFLSLYLVCIGLSSVIFIVGSSSGIWGTEGFDPAHPILTMLNILSFRRIFLLSDVLVVYCVLFLLLPYELILLEKRKTLWLIIISLGLYMVNIIYPDFLIFPFDMFVKVSAVQLIFVIGLIMGYHRVLENIQKKINSRWLWITGISFLFLVVFWNYSRNPSIFPNLPSSDQFLEYMDTLTAKKTIAPGRLLASVSAFGFLYLLLTRFWKSIERLIGWLILPLGENSLFAYTFHVIIIIVGTIILHLGGFGKPSYWASAVLQVVTVLIIWVCIKKKWFTPKPANRKLYYLLPVIIISAIIIIETIFHSSFIQALG